MFGFRHAAKANVKVCGHQKAIPRWDRIEETGNMERVSQWYCPQCDQFVASPAEVPGGQKAMP